MNNVQIYIQLVIDDLHNNWVYFLGYKLHLLSIDFDRYRVSRRYIYV